MERLVVIYYHDVVKLGEGYSYQRIEEEKFEQQMRFLTEQGYHSILFEDLGNPLPEKPIMITFDDAFRSVYETAVPIMKKYGMKGNVFLPTKYVEEGHPHFMTWNMIKELYDEKFFDVAAHTHSHVDIRTLSYEMMKNELETSNSLIRNRIGKEADCFCMPYGTYNASSIRDLRKAYSYRFLFACYYGGINEKKLKKGILPRIGISNDDTMEVFANKLSGKLDWKGVAQRARLMLTNLKGERVEEYTLDY